MVETVHELDPQADVVIILKQPLSSFAIWKYPSIKEDTEAANSSWDPAVPTLVDEAIDQTPSVENNADENTATWETDRGAATIGELNSTDISTQVADRPGIGIEEKAIKYDTCEDVKDQIIYYHVSSRHLQLASSRFASMLSSGNWRESIPNEVDGRYHITTTDWDADALLVLLNVLHNRNHHVPRSVSLELLAKIAVLIDYYDCAEAVEFCTERWVERLHQTCPIPSTFCRDLILWMCVAWVFKLRHEYSETTQVAIHYSNNEMSTLGLPIISCVEKIGQARLEAIGTVVSRLHGLLEEYRDSAYVCPFGPHSFECGSILYGALIKEMESAGLLNPKPEDPFPGLSIWDLQERVQKIRSPSWCYSSSHRSRSRHACDLSERVTGIADEYIRSAQGLDLEDSYPG